MSTVMSNITWLYLAFFAVAGFWLIVRAVKKRRARFQALDAKANVALARTALCNLLREEYNVGNVEFWPTPEMLSEYMAKNGLYFKNPLTGEEEPAQVHDLKQLPMSLCPGRTRVCLPYRGYASIYINDQQILNRLAFAELDFVQRYQDLRKHDQGRRARDGR